MLQRQALERARAMRRVAAQRALAARKKAAAPAKAVSPGVQLFRRLGASRLFSRLAPPADAVRADVSRHMVSRDGPYGQVGAARCNGRGFALLARSRQALVEKVALELGADWRNHVRSK